MNFDIDLVVPWVDGSDAEYIKLKNKYREVYKNKITNETDNICRFKDNGELKYLFRSIEQNAKFIRYVFLVTNGQIPKWLNVNHPKIKIITHDQIMPKTALPTFSSTAIETCIANIPGLSDRFLYANDDTFIARPINKSFFFTKKGYPISRLRHIFNTKQNYDNSDMHDKKIMFTLDLFYKKFHKRFNLTEHHNIDVFYKPDILECINIFKEDFDRTCNSRFRQENNISKHVWALYSFYIGHSKIKGYYFFKFIFFFIPLIRILLNKRKSNFVKGNRNIVKGNSKIKTDKIPVYTRIEKLLYRFILKSTIYPNTSKYNIKGVSLFCINDTENSTDEDRKRSIDFLDKVFPDKSTFEL